MRAKKSLGQNFLKSKEIVGDIVRAGEVREGDLVLEIGPGKGILTEALLKTGASVIAVEKDDELYVLLQKIFVEEIKLGKLNLIHGDILKIDLSHLEKYKLVANIPYNITGEILRSFLTRKNQPETIVLLLQKEVVERIVAKDGKESILSISIKAYGDPSYIKKVPRELFSPKPRVDSAILLIKNISKSLFKDISEEEFFKLVKQGFSQKRKKLSNNLKPIFKEKTLEIFEKTGLDLSIRAEELSVGGWFDLLYQNLKTKFGQPETRSNGESYSG